MEFALQGRELLISLNELRNRVLVLLCSLAHERELRLINHGACLGLKCSGVGSRVRSLKLKQSFFVTLVE